MSKQIPPDKIRNTGMTLYAGAIIDNLRFRTYVPTTIYDPRVAEIRVYAVEDQTEQRPTTPEELVKTEYVKLKSLPKWDVGAQCLTLSRRDEKKLLKALSKLERELL